jgi:hypothetical protein
MYADTKIESEIGFSGHIWNSKCKIQLKSVDLPNSKNTLIQIKKRWQQ